ncbi:FtsX-like permease family protein [Fusibacter bizertensis]
MNKTFYIKLAFSNLRKNARLFAPYILMNIGIITMFYIMHAIASNEGLKSMPGSSSLKIMLGFGTYVIAIFSAIFMFYTNSFLIKRRKKEIGLYSILGMGKRHIGVMLLLEAIFIAVICISIGLVSGIVLSKLMFLILLKILSFSVAFNFSISMASVSLTVIYFSTIFLVTLVYNLGHIHLSNPIQLLKGSSVGEKEPKTKWIMTLIGLISLGSGYILALTVKAPLQALFIFFIAVILVMIGTYFLFIAGSIAALKLLKKNKSFYYKSKHFTSISGMIYRMKQNAVGLANICILSTAVLVTLSTTVSLYVGMEDVLGTQFPYDIEINNYETNDTIISDLNKSVDLHAEKNNVTIIDRFGYRLKSFAADKDNTNLSRTTQFEDSDKNVFTTLVTVQDYNQMTGESIALEDDQILIFSNLENYGFDQISINQHTFNIVKELDTFAGMKKATQSLATNYYIVVKDLSVMDSITSTFPEDADTRLKYSLTFNTTGDSDNLNAFNLALVNEIKNGDSNTYVQSKLLNKSDFFSIYGGFFFIGIFLGALFLMATVMIIYYKQVSEGYDDKVRFEIMQKVGMSIAEIKRTIKTQIVMVFFLPLLFAIIHIAFAFNVITKLLFIFSFTNVPLFIVCTLGTIFTFGLIYLLVYLLTARAYYRIIK